MPYNPAEGNLSYSEEELDEEKSKPHYKAIPPEEKDKIKRDFLELLVRGFSVSGALQKLNGTTGYTAGPKGRVSAKTIYAWRNTEPDFYNDWDHAVQIGSDLIEDSVLDWIRESQNISGALRFLALRNKKRYGSESNDEPKSSTGVSLSINISNVDPTQAANIYQQLIGGGGSS